MKYKVVPTQPCPYEVQVTLDKIDLEDLKFIASFRHLSDEILSLYFTVPEELIQFKKGVRLVYAMVMHNKFDGLDEPR